MWRRLVIAAALFLVALGLWFVLTWNDAPSEEDAASAVERIRRSDYPPGLARETWALDDAPDVSPDFHGKAGEEAEDGGLVQPAPH